MEIEVKSHKYLSELLPEAGDGFALPCGYCSGCGKCRIKLLSGVWESRGQTVFAPAEVPLAGCRLKSVIGTLEINTVSVKTAVESNFSDALMPEKVTQCAVAVDLGSTTLAGMLLRPDGGMRTSGVLNEQVMSSDNVPGRIALCPEHFGVLCGQLEDSFRTLLKNMPLDGISRIAVAGNTAMSCFFHKVLPSSLGTFPFLPPQTCFDEFTFDSDLKIATVPCISGWLGGDITAGLYAADLQPFEMFIDLGTNCEIVFRTPDGMIGCAAAAGPAFEGRGISSGARAGEGVITSYRSGDDFTVIGGGAPTALCGSALVDFLAVEFRKGHLNRFGNFSSGENAVEIAPGVTVTAEDIEQLIKAKAAVGAAVKAIETHTGHRAKKIILGGAFAAHLDLESARAVGLLPELDTLILGNTSLAGAIHLAAFPEIRPVMEKLAGSVEEVHLNLLPEFERFFISGLCLDKVR